MVCCCCCCCCCCFCCCCCNSHVPLLAIFSYVQKYRSLQPEYRHAHYLSVVQSFPNRRLINRFRCGCHGLHVDTGRFVNTPRDDRVCEVCKSGCVENEHHFLSAYAHIRYSHATLFHGIQTVSSVINSNNSCLLGCYLRQCFEHRQCVLG